MVIFSSASDLKAALLEVTPDEFYNRYIEGRDTPHFSNEKLQFVSSVFEDFYRVSPNLDEMVIVGSSKLGYALHDKYQSGKIVGKAFRPYTTESDIDLAICSPRVFCLFWHELSQYSCTLPRMPVDNALLADYLVYGWLRQNHLPIVAPRLLMNCYNLRFVKGRIRQHRTKGHPKLELAIFHDKEHLRLYQCRSIRDCRNKLEQPL